MQRAAELDGYVLDNNDMTDRFENDYRPNVNEEVVPEDTKKKPKKAKRIVKKDKRILTKRERSSVIPRKSKTGKSQSADPQDILIQEQVAGDVLQDGNSELNEENHESTT